MEPTRNQDYQSYEAKVAILNDQVFRLRSRCDNQHDLIRSLIWAIVEAKEGKREALAAIDIERLQILYSVWPARQCNYASPHDDTTLIVAKEQGNAA